MSSDNGLDETAITTELLAQFVSSAAEPPTVQLEAAQRLVVQIAGAVDGGSGRSAAREVALVADQLVGGADEVAPEQVPAQWQAWRWTVAAGASERATDLAEADLRLAEPIVCAALAVHGRRPDETSGAEVGRAVAGGLEVASRVRRAFTASRPDAPWDIAAVAARFGVVAAVGRLLGLDTPTVVQAFGIAGGQSGGLAVAVGDAHSRQVQAARASFDGVEAAQLAARGFTASSQIVEGVGGAGDVLYHLAANKTREVGA